MMTREEVFAELIRQGLSERQANWVADHDKAYHITPKKNKVVVDFKPEFVTNNDRLKDFSEKFTPKNFKKSFPYYNTFNGWKKVGYKVKSGEKSGAKCDQLYKVGRKWELKETPVFSFKQVEPLENSKKNSQTEKAEVKADKPTAKNSKKNSKPTAKAKIKVTNSDLEKQAVKTDFIPVDTSKAEPKPYKPSKRRNKNTKPVEVVTEKYGDVTARVENCMLMFDDPAITF